MLFSSNDDRLHKDFFVKMISKILKDNQLEINREKLRRGQKKIVLNGYVISNHISLSRNKLKKVNSILYSFENIEGKKLEPKNFFEFYSRLSSDRSIFPDSSLTIEKKYDILFNYLAGYRSYLLSFSKEKHKDTCVDYSGKIEKLEYVLSKLNKWHKYRGKK